MADADASWFRSGHGVMLTVARTLRASQGYGFAARGTLPVFQAYTMTQNTKGPASANSEVVHQLAPS